MHRLSVLVSAGLLVGFATGCQPPVSEHPCGGTTTAAAYGAFTPRLADGTIRTTPAGMVIEGKALGVKVLRAEQDITSTVVPERKAFDDAGIATLLTIRNDPQRGPDGRPTVYPPNTPDELATFRTDLEASLKANPPCLVAVENEEVGSPFVSGTTADYIGELKAAIDVGHKLGIPVTNGGIVSGVTALLTWHDLFLTEGKPAADDFARRAFVRPNQTKLLNNLLASADATVPPGPIHDNLAAGEELIASYRTLPLDYVNFHWYIDDDEALTQAVTYLRKATGKQVVTHEMGQYDTNPATVTGHLATLDRLDLPIIIWFDADGNPAFGLHDEPGHLRPSGTAYRTYVDGH